MQFIDPYSDKNAIVKWVLQTIISMASGMTTDGIAKLFQLRNLSLKNKFLFKRYHYGKFSYIGHVRIVPSHFENFNRMKPNWPGVRQNRQVSAKMVGETSGAESQQVDFDPCYIQKKDIKTRD